MDVGNGPIQHIVGVMDQLPAPVLVGNDMGHIHCSITPTGPQGQARAALETTHPKTLGQDCSVYVGNLGQHGNKAVLDQAFGVYGPLRRIWVAQKPPGFAFVEFEDPRDAATAVQGLNGKNLCGSHIKVEFSIRQRHRKRITMYQLAPATRNYRLNQNSSGFLNFSQSMIPSASGPHPTEGSPIHAHPLVKEPCGCVKNIGGIDLMSF
ncbi:hypothetical protein XELAEV_18037210mg [Xenopus laevis]|uniref:RRM domain-containing protein n=1 Tax=Xenopus laevis TaxID=8355 RepID=A0A974CBV8_XENLA|nr:hypothetical protein XELAEV_18037210mg [Xenopus laevis]